MILPFHSSVPRLLVVTPVCQQNFPILVDSGPLTRHESIPKKIGSYVTGQDIRPLRPDQELSFDCLNGSVAILL